jgi:hypothetical protein
LRGEEKVHMTEEDLGNPQENEDHRRVRPAAEGTLVAGLREVVSHSS